MSSRARQRKPILSESSSEYGSDSGSDDQPPRATKRAAPARSRATTSKAAKVTIIDSESDDDYDDLLDDARAAPSSRKTSAARSRGTSQQLEPTARPAAKPAAKPRSGAPKAPAKPDPSDPDYAQGDNPNEVPLLDKRYSHEALRRLLHNKFESALPQPDVIRILITTDNHLGYAEDNPIRGEDSFRTFEECLRLGRDSHCDLFLFGGDLFHENKPSRNTLLRTTQLLKHYCTGPEQPSIRIISDEKLSFPDGRSNLGDPSHPADVPMNISIPAFTIHGNHDDPTGHPAISALDILHEAKLINYFGKHSNLDTLTINPVVIQKSTSFLALYGIGNLRDERMAAIFRRQSISFNQFVLSEYVMRNNDDTAKFNTAWDERQAYVDACQALLQQRVEAGGSPDGDRHGDGGDDGEYYSAPQKKGSAGKKTKSGHSDGNGSSSDRDPTVPTPYDPTEADLDQIFGPLPYINRQFANFDPTFIDQADDFQTALEALDNSIFHLPIIHQNRCRSCLANKGPRRSGKDRKPLSDTFTEHSRTPNSINPCLLPRFADLIVWGHEHCSFPEVLRINPAETNRKLRQEYEEFLRVEREAKKAARLEKRQQARAQRSAAAAAAAKKKPTKGPKAPTKRGGKASSMADDSDSDADGDNGNDNGDDDDDDDDDNADAVAAREAEEQLRLQFELVTHDREVRVLQPGSTVITSLCDGESFAKHCFILEVRGDEYRVTPIKLHTARQFVIQDLILTEEQEAFLQQPDDPQESLPITAAGNRSQASGATAAGRKRAAGKAGAPSALQSSAANKIPKFTQILIDKILSMLHALNPRIPRHVLPRLAISDRFIAENPHLDLERVLDLPLVRLRLTKSDFRDKFTISTYFAGRVANPGDITLVVKPKLTKAQRQLLQQQIHRPATSLRVANLVSNVTAGLQKKKALEMVGLSENAAGANDDGATGLAHLASSISEIPDLLLLNLINDGNLSLVEHQIVLEGLGSYVNNRDNNQVGKKSGLENPWLDSISALSSDLHQMVQTNLNTSFVKTFYRLAVERGDLSEKQYSAHVRDYMTRARTVDQIENDQLRQSRGKELHDWVNGLRAKGRKLMLEFGAVGEDEENHQSDRVADEMFKHYEKTNNRYNRHQLNEKMRLIENDASSSSSDSDGENDDDDDNGDDQRPSLKLAAQAAAATAVVSKVEGAQSTAMGDVSSEDESGDHRRPPPASLEEQRRLKQQQLADQREAERKAREEEEFRRAAEAAEKKRLHDEEKAERLRQEQLELEAKAKEDVLRERERQTELLQRQAYISGFNDLDDDDDDLFDDGGDGPTRVPTGGSGGTKPRSKADQQVFSKSGAFGYANDFDTATVYAALTNSNQHHTATKGPIPNPIDLLSLTQAPQQDSDRFPSLQVVNHVPPAQALASPAPKPPALAPHLVRPPGRAPPPPPPARMPGAPGLNRPGVIAPPRGPPPPRPPRTAAPPATAPVSATTVTNSNNDVQQSNTHGGSPKTNIYDLSGCGDDPNAEVGNYTSQERDQMVQVVKDLDPAASIAHTIPSAATQPRLQNAQTASQAIYIEDSDFDWSD